jgi:transcription termination factor Rho
LVEQGEDVVVLMDSITRLARASNLTVDPSGRTLSGGLDPTALYRPKRFLGAARNIENGGSLTILATILVETGSRMDDMIFEEFKATGNMELVLDRGLSEKKIFPAIDIRRSGTRHDELLMNREEMRAISLLLRALHALENEEATRTLVDGLKQTETNAEFLLMCQKRFRSVGSVD